MRENTEKMPMSVASMMKDTEILVSEENGITFYIPNTYGIQCETPDHFFERVMHVERKKKLNNDREVITMCMTGPKKDAKRFLVQDQ